MTEEWNSNNHINSFASLEESLEGWDKFYLIVVDDPFNVLLD